VSTAAIVETLAKEFNVDLAHAQRVHDLLSAGFTAPTLSRYRRAEIGSATDGTIHRFARRMRQLDELEKRRQSLLRSIEQQLKSGKGAPQELSSEGGAGSLDALRSCMDRFELEDLFLPHRRPEPEVQLALDRGLGALADLLVAPVPRAPKAKESPPEPEPEPVSDAGEPETTESETTEPETTEPETTEPEATEPETTEPEATEPEATEPEATEPEATKPEAAKPEAAKPEAAKPDVAKPGEPYVHATRIDLSPELSRLCAPFVNTDRGVHSDEQALEGAMRILSDRLGRSPTLRGLLRRMLTKHGRIKTRPLAAQKKSGHNRSSLKVDAPIRQIQGHRLLALRQAQSQRLVATSITVDEKLVLPKVRAALGRRIRPEAASVADVVAEQALRQRLLPMIEEDVRGELRERADEEAIRFLAQHLRQILLAPPGGPRPAAGVHVDAKGDWLIVVLDAAGEPVGEEIRIEASAKTPAELAESLGEALRKSGIQALAAGHGKAAREAVQKLRETIDLLKAEACVFLVNEAGLSSYANSEQARHELPDHSVPARQAISLARRLQDPLRELLKTDPRHLGLGREQSVVSKANLRRVLHDTVESCVAHVGCDLNTAPLSLLRHVPGLNFELAKKLIDRRAERPFTSREELRTEGLLDDVAWTNAIGFLRVADSHEPLDGTALHPEQYDLVRRIILENGSSVEDALGRRDSNRGMKRAGFEVDELTWRDFTREISHPGRDPRPRLFLPQLMAPDADPKALEKGQVVEGIVSNVASFGAFIDLGIPRDGMIHISEISSRYVRDARGLLSIGQIIRGRVLDSSGQRVELSLKNVPDPRRRGGPGERRPARGGRPGAGHRGKQGDSKEVWPEHKPVLRAARSRRDGLVTGEKREGRGGGRGGGGRPKTGAGGRRPGGRGRRNVDEHYDPEAVRQVTKTSAGYSPFASFFKDKGGEKKEEATETD